MAAGFQAVQFESARIMRLQPGDVVVLRVRAELDDETHAQFVAQTKALFPDHQIAVLADGAELEVFRKD
jgi:hypothetical protein